MQKNNSKKVSFSDFEGIDTRKSRSKEPSIYDINNFLISPDGALSKRFGYSCIHETTEAIRDIWSGVLGDKFSYIYVQGSSVYSLDIDSWLSTKIASLSTSDGPAQIFYYESSLFILDSAGLFRITDEGALPVLGYIPLYGKNWGTSYPGEINEPLNLLNGYARISYVAPPNCTVMLATKLPVKQIISVYKNGVKLEAGNYRYDEELKYIALPGLQEGDTVKVTLIFDVDFSNSGIKKCTHASVFGDANNSRLLLWSDKENVMFPSRYVSGADYAESSVDFPECTRLYFPVDNSFVIGDGRYKPKAVTRHYDRLLIFTEGDAWMASSSELGTSDLPAMSINSSVGCASTLGTVLLGNSPITVGKSDVFQWTSDTDELNECSAFSISKEINERLPENFFKNAIVFKNVYRNELWLHNPSVSGDVWIYNVQRKAWVRFSEIYADKFFDADGDVGFVRGGNIYVFGKYYFADKRENLEVHNIDASVTLGNLDFGSSELKRLSAYTLDAELDGGEIGISFVTDLDETVSDTLNSTKPRILKHRRLHSGRFSYLKSVTLTAQQYSKQLIREIEINVR